MKIYSIKPTPSDEYTTRSFYIGNFVQKHITLRHAEVIFQK